MSQTRALRRLYGMDTHNAMPPPLADACLHDGSDRVWAEFQQALAQVPLLPRLAFLLSDVLGKPMNEVARLLGHDRATCQQLVDDARSRLRALRAGGHGDQP